MGFAKRAKKLELKVELYFKEHPVRANDTELQEMLSSYGEYCALYVQEDGAMSPFSEIVDAHNRATDIMEKRFGVNSRFEKKHSSDSRTRHVSYITTFLFDRYGLVPYYLDERLTTINHKTLRNRVGDPGYKQGGFFFHELLLEPIIAAFQKLGYEVIKKYESQ